MYSLNVPLPAAVRREVESLRPALSGFETVRETPTLVVKRFGPASPVERQAIESEVRLALVDVEPFEARLDGVGTFEAPVSGPAPVAYLAVESPSLVELHGRLVDRFGSVEGLEGDDYVAHVTLARGGDAAALDGLDDGCVAPVEWTVSELWLWDGSAGRPDGRVALSE